MMLTDPLKQLETRILAFVKDEVKQDRGDPFPFEELARLGRRRCGRRPVSEVVQVDPQLLLRRGLILDHQYRRSEHFGGAVHLEAGRQWRQPNLPAPGLSPLAASYSGFFQGSINMKFNDYSLYANMRVRMGQLILSVGSGVNWKNKGVIWG